MDRNLLRRLCISHVLDGLRDGLSHFSGPSRAAVIYAVTAVEPMHVYDPQNLLAGHEPKLKELYLDSDAWRTSTCNVTAMNLSKQSRPESIPLAGLISYGSRSPSIFYQMWFTEHHPNMCSTGPTERWLEHAVWLLSQDFATENVSVGASGYVLQEYATHAVRDHIVDERNVLMGLDSSLRVYPILDAILGISKTMEEGAWARGRLVFIEPSLCDQVDFLMLFPKYERPALKNFKHVRKLMQAVEGSDRFVVSDGNEIKGVARGRSPEFSVEAEFRGGYGFVLLDGEPVCSFMDGKYQSSTRQAKMVRLEEALLDCKLDPVVENRLFKVVQAIVHSAQERRHGCTIILDLAGVPLEILGQSVTKPLDLSDSEELDLAKSLAKVDGALHIGPDLKLHAFACLLDGLAVPGENRSRGARFNSALRFTAMHEGLIVVVVSMDRPVSVIQSGVELTAVCEWASVKGAVPVPPTLEEWIEAAQ